MISVNNRASQRVISLGVLCLLLGLSGCSDAEPVKEINVGATLVAAEEIQTSAADWPCWRGPNRNGTQYDISVPAEFGPKTNVIWKTPVPGRGHADPTVVGDRIFLATAEESPESQSVLCFDRLSGKQLWKTTIHSGGFESAVHNKATQASNTVACDGSRVFACFLNAGKIRLTCLDIEGVEQWQTTLGEFSSRFGYSASPAIFESYVIVCADHDNGGFLAAVHRESGKIAWRKKRTPESSYASPIVAKIAGQNQCIVIGAEQVISYSPNDGKENWRVKATASSAVGSVVWNETHVFASGGYSQRNTACISADGSAEIQWQNSHHAYVPSLLYHDGSVFCVDDDGKGFCWNASDGAKKWQKRIQGKFSTSPILAGDKIYAASEQGDVVVFNASSEGYKELARNKMGSEIFASPVIAHDCLFLRVADRADGKRQEHLYCIGESSAASKK
jgi:outer membrane protein assembly factor BamB